MRLALISLPDIDLLSEVNGRESRRGPLSPIRMASSEKISSIEMSESSGMTRPYPD